MTIDAGELSPPEAERRRIQRQHSLDDDRVLTFNEWCALNGIGKRTGRRIIRSGNGPVVTQLSEGGSASLSAIIAAGRKRGRARQCAAEKRRPSGAVAPKTADVMICLGSGSARKLSLIKPRFKLSTTAGIASVI